MLYTGRAIWKWSAASSPAYLIWERGFVIAAVWMAALGFVLLERLLEAAGNRILAPLGMVTFLTAVILVIVAEGLFLSKQEWAYALVVLFVVLAFLGQVIFGVALLLIAFLPGWVGWAAIVWNLAWLVILLIARPQDIYYPWLHYAAPLLIGIMLLLRA
jgi:hypothetical protein